MLTTQKSLGKLILSLKNHEKCIETHSLNEQVEFITPVGWQLPEFQFFETSVFLYELLSVNFLTQCRAGRNVNQLKFMELPRPGASCTTTASP
jgi:hypothetical protein